MIPFRTGIYSIKYEADATELCFECDVNSSVLFSFCLCLLPSSKMKVALMFRYDECLLTLFNCGFQHMLTLYFTWENKNTFILFSRGNKIKDRKLCVVDVANNHCDVDHLAFWQTIHTIEIKETNALGSWTTYSRFRLHELCKIIRKKYIGDCLSHLHARPKKCIFICSLVPHSTQLKWAVASLKNNYNDWLRV